MQKLVSKKRVQQLILKNKKPLVLAQNGQMLPSLRGFDVTDYFRKKDLVGDIPDLLHLVNARCPIAYVYGISNGGDLFSISLGDIQLRFWLSKYEIAKIEIIREFASTRKPIKRVFRIEGYRDFIVKSLDCDSFEYLKDFKQVFNLDLVKRHIAFAILRKELLEEYEI